MKPFKYGVTESKGCKNATPWKWTIANNKSFTEFQNILKDIKGNQKCKNGNHKLDKIKESIN